MYYYFAEDMQIWFLTLYDKGEAADLTAKEKRLLKTAIEQERPAATSCRKEEVTDGQDR